MLFRSISDGLGRFDEAMRHHELGLESLRARLGDRHPRVADMELNIGAAYSVSGDIEDRKSAVSGKSVDLGGRRSIKKKKSA